VLREAEMNFDENYCNITSNHERKPGEIYRLSYSMELFVEVRTFFVKVGIALPTANGKFESTIQNTVLDVCKYLKTNNANLILRLFFNGNFEKKKFPKACPIKPDVYFMENFRINDNMLTIRSGEMKFLITVEFCLKLSERMHCILNAKFYGELKDQGKWQQEVENLSKIEAKN
jgi:hypothetical protein